MQVLDLTGRWTLRQRNQTGTIPARVPGDNVSALLAAGKIPDPYRADNEARLQWIGRVDWIYEREFHVSKRFLDHRSIRLHCDSLDTVATVFINDRRVTASDNMFAAVRAEVRRLLKPGRNVIRIEFASPERTALARARRLPYPIPTNLAPVYSPHRNLVRKVQCHAGWDWGICLMVSGIYGRIELQATSLGHIESVVTAQHHQRGRVTVDVTTTVDSPAGGRTELEVSLAGQQVRRPVTLKPGHNELRTRLVIANPRLWWPNGYGAQPLYPLVVRVAGAEVRKRLGLRSLEVVSREDARGLSLVFRVNGVDIFAKGANWIPCDAMPQRQTRAVLEHLLESARRAHMNMLRVWGGGQYESDDFYDLCDEKGLLVWQDFMFSCSLYPATPAFLDSVRREARHQVLRLRDHACLALWCGNNENLGALNWYEESRQNRDRYVVDYDRLNEGVLGQVVDECDPTRRFWPSSPCGGRGDYSANWHKDNRGDMHYWSVWHEGKPFDAYYDVRPRFCSEFGYQSFPSLDTIRRYAPRDQFNVTAPVMEWHQRHPRGNSIIVEMFTRYFRMPEGFANFVYLSQVQQAMAIKTAVEYWRTLRPHCMGTLYWQLNDNWPVCSWSSIEYGGKWKLLHYAAQKFYAPILLSIIPRGDHLELWLTNDGDRPVRGPVTVELRDFTGTLQRRFRLPVTVGARRARRLQRWKRAELAPAPDKVFLYVRFGDAVQTHFFVPYKQCDLAQPRLQIRCRRLRATRGLPHPTYEISLRADKPAFFVALDAAGIRGEFDDNLLTVLPGKIVRVRFTARQPVTLARFRAALSVQHLRGTYA